MKKKPHNDRPVVLIVEDEALLRMDAADIVSNAGYDVLEAANADEAIALLESNPNISVIFTDINMPGSMDGLRLSHAVRDRWPPVKIVATSGHSRIDESELPTGGRFIQKPYSAPQVSRVLHQVLHA